MPEAETKRRDESSAGVLTVDSINTFYADSHILHDLSLAVDRGEVVSLLGRNGVGKTTTLRSIMGLTPPRNGSIQYEGEEIVGLPPHEILQRGIAIVPEEREIFPQLSVAENLRVAAQRSGDEAIREFTVADIYDLFPRLDERREQEGHSLSGGEQQMLAIARALMTSPDVLMLDEPTEGLAPKIIEDVVEIVEEISETGLTIMLVEQNVNIADYCADRHYILEKGEVKFEGHLDDLNEDRRNSLLGVN
ncbi:ABC transporter ATP-binding protein [Halorientalis sp. IM1011]|uniref:ABC transporter ATP-binding protein n=1 Tax=Halorientalis sp. IM1011 TaxID=1932360 RepID=UPI00097CCF1A|nr:ABC transporter ATP-binding protein [Halorientalis sp. IM1011]AQL44356.1 ABC transporter ATP-binding protein [Halorientalis sp. IM1011]